MSRSLSNKDAGFRNKQERAEYFLLDERRLRQTKVTDLDRKLWEKVIQFIGAKRTRKTFLKCSLKALGSRKWL